MQVRHPYAGDDDAGPPPSHVDVNGRSVPVDDGTFEVSDDRWLQDFADAHDCSVDDLVVDQDADQDAETCDVVKNDGEVCGRPLPCPYHRDDPDAEADEGDD